MASSFNRRSSSSASSGAKPTFRRATGSAARSGRPASAAPAPERPTAPVRASRPAASYPVRAGKAPVRTRALAAPKAGTGRAIAPVRPDKVAPVRGGVSTAGPQASAAARTKMPATGGSAPRPRVLPAAAAPRTFKSVAASAPKRRPGRSRGPLAGALASVGGAIAAAFASFAGLVGRIPHPKVPRRVLIGVVAGVAAVALVLVVVANSGLFAATDIQVNAGEHLTKAEVETLLEVPEDTNLLNVDTSAIAASLERSPWVSGVTVERKFPHTLVVTPQERTVAAIAYIAADDVAWAVSSDETWIAPVTLSVTADEKGNIIEGTSRLSTGAHVSELTGADAAAALAKQAGAVLLTDVSADVSPASGEAVSSKVIKAGLAYAKGFSSAFLAQVKSISVPSEEAIAADLENGVEVSLGSPENIATKERVITKLLEQEEGVTYINVRTPDSYTFRAADAGN